MAKKLSFQKEHPTKKSNKQFEDFNFKLVVMNELLENGSFSKELKKLTNKYDKPNNYQPIPQIKKYLEEIELTEEDLLKVTELSFDGGNHIYSMLVPNWDGEDDQFDVKSIKGYELLKNLKKIFKAAMVDNKLLKPLKDKGIRITGNYIDEDEI